MNIAFPALVVTLLVLPGILFRYGYRRGLFARSPSTLGTLQDEVASGVIGALVLNGLAVVLVEALSSTTVNFEALLALLAGWPPVDDGRIGEYVGAVADHAGSILAYLLAVNAMGLALGYLLHAGIRGLKLDLRYDFLRFNNEWHYLFSGEARVFNARQKDRRLHSIRTFLSVEVDFVYISVVVSQDDGAVLYWGVLDDYFFDAAGQLDRIVLKRAQRRRFADDVAEGGEAVPPADERFYKIRGSYLAIQHQNVRTLNVGYKLIDPKRKAGSDETLGSDKTSGVGGAR